MKNLFNNPWFVGALGLFGLFYLGFAVVMPLVSTSQVASSVGLEVPFLGLDDDQTNPVVMSQTTERNLDDIAWLQNIDRDPFAGTNLADPQAGQPVQLPRLIALFVSDGVQAAVLNNKLVRVGDEIDRFFVAEIGKHSVTVSRHGRYYTLEPDV